MYRCYVVKKLNEIETRPEFDSVIILSSTVWNFEQIVNNSVKIESNDIKRSLFVNIDEKLPNHDEILNAIVNALKKTL